MANISIYGEATESSIPILLDSMDTEHPYKRIEFLIALPSDEYFTLDGVVGDNDYGQYCDDGKYIYTYSGLQPGTRYKLRAIIKKRISVGNFEYEEYNLDAEWETAGDSGGGGGGTTDPYFTAGNYGDDGIQVAIYDPSSIITDEKCRVYIDGVLQSGLIYLYRTNEWSDTGFSNGDHTVAVDYMAGGRWYALTYSGGGYSTTVTIGGGGGGGGGGEDLWKISSENLGTLSSSIYTYRHYEPYTLYRFTASFENAGTVTFYSNLSTYDAAIDPKGWITEHATTYNSDTGEPSPSTTVYADDDDSGDESRQFRMTYDGIQAGVTYDFWFKLYDGNLDGYGYIGIDPPQEAAQTWSYNTWADITGVSSEISPDYDISERVGALIRVNFARAGTASVSLSGLSNTLVYVTSSNSWFDDADGVPYADSSQTSKASGSTSQQFTVTAGQNDYFCIWIKGANASVSGRVTITITPPEDTSWQEIFVSGVNVGTSVIRYTRPIAKRRTYRYELNFSKAGKIRIYSTGSTSTADVIAYWSKTYSAIAPDDGIPPSARNSYWDDVIENGVRDYNFDSGEIEVTAGTYYLWVKGINSETAIPNLMIYMEPVVEEDGKVRIFNGTDWITATPYIFNGSAWVKAAPWIYTGDGGWKKCK